MTSVDDAPPATKHVNWGDEIRKIREAQGLSQRRLTKLADVDRASLLRFEKGDSRGATSAWSRTGILTDCLTRRGDLRVK